MLFYVSPERLASALEIAFRASNTKRSRTESSTPIERADWRFLELTEKEGRRCCTLSDMNSNHPRVMEQRNQGKVSVKNNEAI
jgi:hypothetical protein